MVIEKTEKNHLKEENCLNDILKVKKKDYVENVFSKCSIREKQKFIKNIATINYSDSGILFSFIGMLMSIIGITGLAVTSSPYFLYLEILGIFMMGIFHIPFIQNKLINIWLSEKKNIELLQTEMFKEKVVDKDILKFFAKSYSERQLVLLLNEKEALTYKDIYFYIANENKYKESDKKTKNLSKAVKCLLD